MNSKTSTSKFLSLVLRHRPEVIGLQLDPQGWLPIDALIEGTTATKSPKFRQCSDFETCRRALESKTVSIGLTDQHSCGTLAASSNRA